MAYTNSYLVSYIKLSSNHSGQRTHSIDRITPYCVVGQLTTESICKRNGKKRLLWLGDKNKTLNYSPKSDEMILTVLRWFANKSCPGGLAVFPAWGSGLQGNGSTGRLVFWGGRLSLIPCPQKLVGRQEPEGGFQQSG